MHLANTVKNFGQIYTDVCNASLYQHTRQWVRSSFPETLVGIFNNFLICRIILPVEVQILQSEINLVI